MSKFNHFASIFTVQWSIFFGFALKSWGGQVFFKGLDPSSPWPFLTSFSARRTKPFLTPKLTADCLGKCHFCREYERHFMEICLKLLGLRAQISLFPHANVFHLMATAEQCIIILKFFPDFCGVFHSPEINSPIFAPVF